jgi:hypothetical protein
VVETGGGVEVTVVVRACVEVVARRLVRGGIVVVGLLVVCIAVVGIGVSVSCAPPAFWQSSVQQSPQELHTS